MKTKLFLIIMLMIFSYGCMPVKADVKFDTTIKTTAGNVACNLKFDLDSEGKAIEATAHCDFTVAIGDKNFRCEDIGLEYVEKTLDVETVCSLETID